MHVIPHKNYQIPPRTAVNIDASSTKIPADPNFIKVNEIYILIAAHDFLQILLSRKIPTELRCRKLKWDGIFEKGNIFNPKRKGDANVSITGIFISMTLEENILHSIPQILTVKSCLEPLYYNHIFSSTKILADPNSSKVNKIDIYKAIDKSCFLGKY